MIKGKKILIGVSGGIAAYKIPMLVRLLVKDGAEVKVVMTKDAENFVTRQTLSVLSKNKVESAFFDSEMQWNNHVDLGLWPDLFLVAPATANTLGKMAHGICDNLLIASYLSSRCPVMIAPAMDADMFLHFSTEENIALLKKKGAIIIPPVEGELASGLSGPGRMEEPDHIYDGVKRFFNPLFKGKKVLINAGPTYEAIDPVRFIGNRSSGKTGVFLAEAFSQQGAEVVLVLGPGPIDVNDQRIKLIRVESAEEMKKASLENFAGSDVFIAAAAVADYRPKNAASQKIKKKEDTLILELVKNPDILAEAGKMKKNGQIIAGFALETENVMENALEKLKRKNMDMIIVNSPNEKGEGFGFDTNRISVIDKHNKIVNFELMHKKEMSFKISALIYEFMNEK